MKKLKNTSSAQLSEDKVNPAKRDGCNDKKGAVSLSVCLSRIKEMNIALSGAGGGGGGGRKILGLMARSGRQE